MEHIFLVKSGISQVLVYQQKTFSSYNIPEPMFDYADYADDADDSVFLSTTPKNPKKRPAETPKQGPTKRGRRSSKNWANQKRKVGAAAGLVPKQARVQAQIGAQHDNAGAQHDNASAQHDDAGAQHDDASAQHDDTAAHDDAAQQHQAQQAVAPAVVQHQAQQAVAPAVLQHQAQLAVVLLSFSTRHSKM